VVPYVLESDDVSVEEATVQENCIVGCSLTLQSQRW